MSELSASGAGGTVVPWGGGPVPSGLTNNVLAIAANYAHWLALKADGTVADWGNYVSRTSSYGGVPATVPPGLSNVVAIAAGLGHSLALTEDGRVVAWGTNTVGQLDVPTDLTNVAAIAAGATHNLALRFDGTVVAWGDNSAGEAIVPVGLTNVVAIAAGMSDSLALMADGTVARWGYIWGSKSNLPPGLTNVVAIAAGHDDLALKADGTAVNWQGANHYPVPSDLTNATAVSVGTGNYDVELDLALRADGTVAGWGFLFGAPLVPAGLSNVVAIAAGGEDSLALLGAGSPFLTTSLVDRTAVMAGTVYFRVEATGARPLSYQWHFNGSDLPGATNALLTLTNVQPNQAGLYSVTVSNAIGVSTSASALLREVPFKVTAQPADQTNFIGSTTSFTVQMLGIEPLTYQWQVNGKDLDAATNSTLVLTNLQLNQAGSYSVIVSNAFGTIVSSSATLAVFPVLITQQPQDQVSFVGGTVVLDAAAEGLEPIGYQWRFNGTDLVGATNSSLALSNLQLSQSGQYSVAVSNPTGVTRSSDATLSVVIVAPLGHYLYERPVPGFLTNVMAVGAGLFHDLTLLADGSVVAWGDNNYGETSVPLGLSGVVAVASGSYAVHSLALLEDGTIVSWGSSTFPPYTPPAGLTNVVAVSAGGWHCLALRADGTVVTWGPGASSGTPMPQGLSNVVAIAGGEEHSLALKSDGTVVAWGMGTFVAYPPDYYNYGQAMVPPLSNVVAIAAGAKHSLALLDNGAVMAWGQDASGQPFVPPGSERFVAIAAGERCSFALLSDGTVTNWGFSVGIPDGLTNVVAIAAAGGHGVALVGDKPPYTVARVVNPTCGTNGFSVSVPTRSGRVYRLEYRNSLSEGKWNALPLVAGNGRVRTLTDSMAKGSQRFYRVRQW